MRQLATRQPPPSQEHTSTARHERDACGASRQIRREHAGVPSTSLQQFEKFPVQLVSFEVLVVHI